MENFFLFYKTMDIFRKFYMYITDITNVYVEDWEQMTKKKNRSIKKLIHNGCKAFKVQRVEYSILKQGLWKQVLTLVPDNFQPEHICNICNRVCLFTDGLASQIRSHDSKQLQVDFTQVLPQQSM